MSYRRRLWILWLFLGFLLLVLSRNVIGMYGEPQDDADTSALWLFNGGVTDETGTHNGTDNGTSDTYAVKFGRGRDFERGQSDSVSIPDHGDWDFGTGDYTLEMLVQFESFGDDWNPFWCVESGTEWAYFVYRKDLNELALRTDDGNVGITWNPSTGVWYHIVYSRMSGTLYYYVNGEELGSDTSSINIGGFTRADIGLQNWDSVYFDGIMDYMHIRKGKGLTAAEVKRLYALQQGAYGIID